MAGPAACPAQSRLYDNCRTAPSKRACTGPGSAQLFLISRPPALILIAAPFSSRLSRYRLANPNEFDRSVAGHSNEVQDLEQGTQQLEAQEQEAKETSSLRAIVLGSRLFFGRSRAGLYFKIDLPGTNNSRRSCPPQSEREFLVP